MEWSKLNAGVVNGAVQRMLVSLGNNADDVLTRINEDLNYAALIAEFAVKSLYTPTQSQTKAREIMRKNFFGIEEAIKHFGIKVTKSQLDTLAKIPFTEDHLIRCKNTHVLVATFPLSILDIHHMSIQVSGNDIFLNPGLWQQKAIAGEKGRVGWKLIRKERVSDSALKSWEEQQILIRESQFVPTAQVVIYAMVGHYLATGEWLFKNYSVRTADSCSRSSASQTHTVPSHIGVGNLGNSIEIIDYSDEFLNIGLGLCGAEKYSVL